MAEQVAQVVTKEVPRAAEPEVKQLIVLPYVDRRQNRYAQAWREVKVLWAQCAVCQEKRKPGWYRTCKHQPYTSNVRIDEVEPIIKCNVCGDEVPSGVYAHCGTQDFIQDGERTKPTFIPQFNTRGIRIDETVNSARYLDSARAKGALLPNEMGVATMCEFARCFAPVQTPDGSLAFGAVRTDWGIYCNPDEAKLVALVSGREAVEIFDKGRQADQLRGISL